MSRKDFLVSSRTALFLDVVYNHIGPEGGYLGEYGPYLTDQYRTPWGAAMNFDARGSDAVHAIYDFGARHILQDI